MQNDEIKEILDYLKDDKWDYYPSDGIPYKVFLMEERDKLLDYITNLQQENERLKEELKSIKSNYKIQLEYDENLQERIDEAIDYLQQEGVCIMNKGMNENERLVWNWRDYYYLLDILKGELE